MGNYGMVNGALVITSIVYALTLEWLSRRVKLTWQHHNHTKVVIGVGYVLIALRFLLSFECWLTVCAAFFWASLPLLGRSLYGMLQFDQELRHFLRGICDRTETLATQSRRSSQGSHRESDGRPRPGGPSEEGPGRGGGHT